MSVKLTHGMVLAAGLGTRMRPITNTLPKPLVEVAGRSILDRNVDALHAHGIKNIAINGHHLFPIMENHVANRDDPNITLLHEETLLDQGGGIKNALGALGGADFFVLNGDAFWTDDVIPNLQALEAAWRPSEMDFLLMVAPLDSSTGFDGAGDFYLDADNHVEFRGERATAPYVFTGVGIYKTSVIAQVDDPIFPLVPLYKQAIKTNRVFGMVMQGHWFHIGTPDAIVLAEEMLKSFD